MTDKYYTIRLFDFLRKVAANNNRDWFHSRKSEYDELRAQWLEELDRLVTLMAAWEPQLVSQSAKTCAYRFYRDTRFSQDKSPYKTFFSAAISPWGRKTPRAGYYLHMGIDEENLWGGSGLYGGIWCPDKQMLRKLRHAIIDNIEEFEEIINAPDLQKHYPGWIGESLKKSTGRLGQRPPASRFVETERIRALMLLQRAFFLRPVMG